MAGNWVGQEVLHSALGMLTTHVEALWRERTTPRTTVLEAYMSVLERIKAQEEAGHISGEEAALLQQDAKADYQAARSQLEPVGR